MATTENGDEVAVILEEQREEIMAAKILARDHDLAFNLQMQEALTASRAAHTSSPKSPSGRDFNAATINFTGGNADDGDEFDFTSLILQDIARVDQERQDREFGEQEMKRLKVDLDRRIHDQKFAKEIMNTYPTEIGAKTVTISKTLTPGRLLRLPPLLSKLLLSLSHRLVMRALECIVKVW